MWSIKVYITKDNPKAVVGMIKQIRAAVKPLEEFPNSGRIIPETSNPQLREVIISNYCIMYQISSSSIIIFAVHTGPYVEMEKTYDIVMSCTIFWQGFWI